VGPHPVHATPVRTYKFSTALHPFVFLGRRGAHRCAISSLCD